MSTPSLQYWLLVAVGAVAIIALSLSFQFGVLALLFALVGWWAWVNPMAAFTLLVVLSPLLPMLKITQTIGTVTLVKDIIIFALFASLVGVPLLTKKLQYRRNIVVLPIVALAILTLLALVRADETTLGVLRARDILLYPLLFFVVLYLPINKSSLKALAKWLAISAVGVVLLSAWQWFFAGDSTVLRFDPAREIWIPRISSVLAHPSIYGHYLITVITLLVAAVLTLKGRARFTAAVAGALLLIPLFLTYSRAVWIGLAAAFACVGLAISLRWLKQRGPRVALGGIVGTSVIAVLAVVIVLTTTSAGTFVRSAIDPTYGSNEERLEFMARLLAPLSNSEALVGRGLGDVLAQNFRAVDVSAYDIASGASRTVQLAKNRTLVDNQHLKTFIEMGLAGLLVYAWLYWSLLKTSYVSASKDEHLRKLIGFWGLGFFSAFIIQGFFIDIWDIYPTNAAFWIVAGFVSRLSITHTPKSRQRHADIDYTGSTC